MCFSANSQSKTNIYLLPGQGADCRLFSKLEFDTTHYNLICLSYGTPKDNEDMADFALRIASYIDTTTAYYLVGVSLGGMVATEIAHHFNTDKTIIISSAKNKNELPFRYRFQRYIPIYAIIPPKLLKKGALFLQPIVESDRNKYESTFISMLSSKSPEYFQASISLIVNWRREKCSANIIHIHGTNDHTIPIKNIKDPLIIENGSHMMTLTLYKEIQKNLEPFL